MFRSCELVGLSGKLAKYGLVRKDDGGAKSGQREEAGELHVGVIEEKKHL